MRAEKIKIGGPERESSKGEREMIRRERIRGDDEFSESVWADNECNLH